MALPLSIAAYLLTVLKITAVFAPAQMVHDSPGA
jgi:hypothetical protein